MLARYMGLRRDRDHRRSRHRCVLFVAGVLVLFVLGVMVPAGAGATGVYVSNSNSGSVSVFSIGLGGVLAPLACVPAASCQTGSSPLGVAVDPSASHLYVANSNSASVSVFSIGAGGVLSPVACDATTICKTGSTPTGVAVDPSGSHLYVSNQESASVSVFSIGAGGVLSPVACDPTTICKTGTAPQGIAVDPSGSHLYVVNGTSASVSVFSIGAGGVLSPVACDPTTICKTGAGAKGVAVDPSGSHVYVSNFSSSVSVFSIGAGGVLSPVACDPSTICQTGTNPDIFSLAVSPDRGPVAAFSASAGPAGSVSRFDGSTSSSPDYAFASYVWDFGDGQTQTSVLPAVQHTYAKPGSYPVTLTVTDQAGCALSIVYTGQTASCNGSAKARVTRTITVPPVTLPPVIVPPVAAIGKENISPSVFPAKPDGPSALAAKKRKRTYGAKVTYTLNETASVRFTVQRRSDGRKVKHAKKHTCDRPTKHNRKKQTCIRYVTLTGSFTRAGLTGANKFRFTGRLNGQRLSPGNYRLVATPTANTVTGRAATANFRIIP